MQSDGFVHVKDIWTAAQVLFGGYLENCSVVAHE